MRCHSNLTLAHTTREFCETKTTRCRFRASFDHPRWKIILLLENGDKWVFSFSLNTNSLQWWPMTMTPYCLKRRIIIYVICRRLGRKRGGRLPNFRWSAIISSTRISTLRASSYGPLWLTESRFIGFYRQGELYTASPKNQLKAFGPLY